MNYNLSTMNIQYSQIAEKLSTVRQTAGGGEYWYYLDFNNIFGGWHFDPNLDRFSAKSDPGDSRVSEDGISFAFKAYDYAPIKKLKPEWPQDMQISDYFDSPEYQKYSAARDNFYNSHIRHFQHDACIRPGTGCPDNGPEPEENASDAMLSRYAAFSIFKNNWHFSVDNPELIFAMCWLMLPENDFETICEYTDHYIRKELRDELRAKENIFSGIIYSAKCEDYSDIKNLSHDVLFSGMTAHNIKKNFGIEIKNNDPIANYFSTELLWAKNGALDNLIKKFSRKAKPFNYVDEKGNDATKFFRNIDYDISDVKAAIESEYAAARDGFFGRGIRPEEMMTGVSAKNIKTLLNHTENNFRKYYVKKTLPGRN